MSGLLVYSCMKFLVYGQDPYAGIESGQLLRFLRSGKRMSRPELATNEMFEIMLCYWE